MIARLEYELAEIQRSVECEFGLPKKLTIDLLIRRETLVAKLTKERDDIIRSKKEIKKKYDAADVYLTDYAKVSWFCNWISCQLTHLPPDHQSHSHEGQGCHQVLDNIDDDLVIINYTPRPSPHTQHIIPPTRQALSYYLYTNLHRMTQTGQDDSYNGSTVLTTSLLRSSPPSHLVELLVRPPDRRPLRGFRRPRRPRAHLE